MREKGKNRSGMRRPMNQKNGTKGFFCLIVKERILLLCVAVGYGYLSAPGDGTYEGNGMEARANNKTQRTVSTVSWYVVVVVWWV